MSRERPLGYKIANKNASDEVAKPKRAPLIARPVKEPIDHDAISKKILERFPNTLKYLGR